MLDILKKYLVETGIEIIDVSDDSVSFTKDGLNYLCLYDPKDPFFFRLMLPNVMGIPDGQDAAEVYEAINKINAAFKVGKIVVFSDRQVWVAVESFVYSKENIRYLFNRAIVVAGMMLDDFRRKTENLSAVAR